MNQMTKDVEKEPEEKPKKSDAKPSPGENLPEPDITDGTPGQTGLTLAADQVACQRRILKS